MNAEALYFVFKYIFPATMALLPGRMNTPGAKAMLLAIGLQESRFDHRAQIDGPARGYWQFERAGGVRGVLSHPSTTPIIYSVLQTLNYGTLELACYNALQHNDILACAFARLLLWTVPGALPSADEVRRSWAYYQEGWRPGKPHPETWPQFYAEAWRTVKEE